jgi:hypothetical protein
MAGPDAIDIPSDYLHCGWTLTLLIITFNDNPHKGHELTNEFQNKLLKSFATEYPCCGQPELVQNTILHLSTELSLDLKTSVYQRVEKAIQDLYEYAHSKEYISELIATLPEDEAEILMKRPKNSSVLMAYDFHYDPEKDLLSLIEINTNASAFLFADISNRQSNNPHWSNAREQLLEAFKEEGLKDKVIIIDEDYKGQKMFAEFLLYCEWFSNNGVQAQIKEAEDSSVTEGNSFIYNRFNDFTLAESRSSHLRKSYLSGQQVFSPSPHEFILLADKLRLFNFSKNNISDVIVPMKAFTDFESTEEIWSNRKKYFFKPKRLYGGKAVFRGSSISKTRFEALDPSNYLAQEHRPPGQKDGFKFDLRFFVYRDQIQLGIARFFKGQLLNFNDPDGGLGPIALI